ncbi:MAG: ATP-dependent Clp protease adaptor ClpS [Campylobacter sp.]|nr:ATP-dependent Clp protease adaptor ClpS [Campylobacter sp.]
MATKTQIKTEIKKEPFRPKFYKVILLNDDVTTMDFVVAILVKIFEKSVQDAVDIMFKVHKTGSGVAGIYIKEIAKTKQNAVIKTAKEAGFPLQCILEEE